MRAVAIRCFGGPEVLEVLELDPPEPAPDDVLIATRASGVGPWDTKLRAGAVGTDYPLPWVIGSECAGVIERVGEQVEDLAPGDDVFSYAHIRGTYAELVAAPASATARKPESLSFEEAAALPLAGTTAHQAITDDLGMRAGETLLVTGASGGVGGFALQIAAALGAHVVALARPESHAFVRSLGAAEAVASPDDVPEKVDALLDCVGGDMLTTAVAAVRDNGRAVTLLPPSGDSAERGIAVSFIWGRQDRSRLEALAALADAGTLRVELEAVLMLDEAARAHELIEAGGRRGKIALATG